MNLVFSCQKKNYQHLFDDSNISYLDFNWESNNASKLWQILDQIEEITEIFFDILNENKVMFIFCNSSLIRSISFLTLILMKAFRWTFRKCINYIKIKTSIDTFLNLYQSVLLKIQKNLQEEDPNIPFSDDWDSEFYGEERFKEIHNYITFSFKNIEVII